MMSEEERHNKLMKFMTSFRESMEKDIKETNKKLDSNMEVLNVEMKELKTTIDENKEQANDVFARMDKRLNEIETKMSNYSELKEKRKTDEKNETKRSRLTDGRRWRTL